VYLASETQAFKNWVGAQIFFIGFCGLMGVVAIVVRRRRRSSTRSIAASN
jgi:hypothetical protein